MRRLARHAHGAPYGAGNWLLELDPSMWAAATRAGLAPTPLGLEAVRGSTGDMLGLYKGAALRDGASWGANSGHFHVAHEHSSGLQIRQYLFCSQPAIPNMNCNNSSHGVWAFGDMTLSYDDESPPFYKKTTQPKPEPPPEPEPDSNSRCH